MRTVVGVRTVVPRNVAGGMVDLVDELDGPCVDVDEHATRVVANTPTTNITVTRGPRPDVVAIPVLDLMWILPFYGPTGKTMTSHPPGVTAGRLYENLTATTTTMHGCNAGAVHGGALPHGLDRDHSSLDQLAPTVDTSTLDRGDPPFEAGRAVDHGGLQVPNSQRDGWPGPSAITLAAVKTRSNAPANTAPWTHPGAPSYGEVNVACPMALGGSNSITSGSATGLHGPITTSKGMTSAKLLVASPPALSAAYRLAPAPSDSGR